MDFGTCYVLSELTAIEMRDLLTRFDTKAGILGYLGVAKSGQNYKRLGAIIDEMGLSHLLKRRSKSKASIKPDSVWTKPSSVQNGLLPGPAWGSETAVDPPNDSDSDVVITRSESSVFNVEEAMIALKAEIEGLQEAIRQRTKALEALAEIE